MSTILVPLDGSPHAEQALPHACRLALLTGAELLLVRAALPVVDPEAGVATRSSVQHAEAYLNTLRDRLQAEGFSAESISLFSNPVPGILRVARTHEASTIVMSTHGRTGLRRMVVGSVTEQVVQESLIPVLIVNGDSPSMAPNGRYRRILVPLDGSSYAESALEAVKDLRMAGDVEIVLLQSVQPSLSGAMRNQRLARDLEQRLDAARTYLARAAATMLPGYASSVLTPIADPAAAILTAVEAQHVDLIVLAAHARRGRVRFSPTSVAGQVLRETGTPVLIVRGIDEAGAVAKTVLPEVEQSESEEDSHFDDFLFV